MHISQTLISWFIWRWLPILTLLVSSSSINIGLAKTFLATRIIGTGWGGFSSLYVGDFDGDKDDDIMAVRSSDGELRFYEIANGQFLGNGVNLGLGWETAFSKLMVGDFNGDGHDDLAGVRAGNSELFYYPFFNGGYKEPGTNKHHVIGTGWDIFSEILVGDFDGDNDDDIITVQSSDGELRFYEIQNGQFLGNEVNLGLGWKTAFSKLIVGDFNGDGHDDLAGVRSANGELFYYPFSNGGYKESGTDKHHVIGTGWGGFNHLLVSNFNGDSFDDILGVTPSGSMTFYPMNNGEFNIQGIRSAGNLPSDIAQPLAGDFIVEKYSDLIGIQTTDGKLPLFENFLKIPPVNTALINADFSNGKTVNVSLPGLSLNLSQTGGSFSWLGFSGTIHSYSSDATSGTTLTADLKLPASLFQTPSGTPSTSAQFTMRIGTDNSIALINGKIKYEKVIFNPIQGSLFSGGNAIRLETLEIDYVSQNSTLKASATAALNLGQGKGKLAQAKSSALTRFVSAGFTLSNGRVTDFALSGESLNIPLAAGGQITLAKINASVGNLYSDTLPWSVIGGFTILGGPTIPLGSSGQTWNAVNLTASGSYKKNNDFDLSGKLKVVGDLASGDATAKWDGVKEQFAISVTNLKFPGSRTIYAGNLTVSDSSFSGSVSGKISVDDIINNMVLDGALKNFLYAGAAAQVGTIKPPWEWTETSFKTAVDTYVDNNFKTLLRVKADTGIESDITVSFSNTSVTGATSLSLGALGNAVVTASYNQNATRVSEVAFTVSTSLTDNSSNWSFAGSGNIRLEDYADNIFSGMSDEIKALGNSTFKSMLSPFSYTAQFPVVPAGYNWSKVVKLELSVPYQAPVCVSYIDSVFGPVCVPGTETRYLTRSFGTLSFSLKGKYATLAGSGILGGAVSAQQSDPSGDASKNELPIQVFGMGIDPDRKTFRLGVSGNAERTVMIEVSRDLVVWEPLDDVTLDGAGFTEFFDEGFISRGTSFYRGVGVDEEE